ncbi:radical SAM family heme chaperone HemW [Haloimpatiens sp. FM7315]|uniref:radical SAM family heme chaperone HemW n=1 Tax=Haloimpatiens sp. FM7315 TaxID=3298609 RepID=UPI0035A33BA5
MEEAVALYIHIPFCKQKCFYCDFPSFSGKESLMIDYAKALSFEISQVKNRVKTIFIGGGTPTYLSLDGWNIIKKALDKLNKMENLEFTIEGNPGSFTEDKLKFFKDMGVNRLSIGVQAMQDDILRSLGRIHTVEDFKNSFNMARNIGFDNINLDIMFGVPNQSLKDYENTLKEAVKMNPEHISCYSLIIEEGTKFCNNLKNLSLPSEEEERLMYETTIKILKNSGYEQYEISNYSKVNKECRHNLVYWSLEDYIGCGSSAHSYVKGSRYRNEIDINEYILKIKEKGNAKVEEKINTRKNNMEEFMFLGLRKNKGISKEDFYRKFKLDIYSVYGNTIEKYKKLNFIVDKGDNIYLTQSGLQVSNNIMSDFLLD